MHRFESFAAEAARTAILLQQINDASTSWWMDLFILFDVVTVSPSEKKALAPWLYYILTHRGFPWFFWFRLILKCIEPAVLVVPPRLKKSLMWFWCGPSRVMESSEPPVDKCAWLLVRCGGANDVLPPCVLFNTSVWKHVLAYALDCLK